MASHPPQPVAATVRPSLVAELHPGPGTLVYCDGGPTQVPLLVVSDGRCELLISPADAPTPADVAFAEALAAALVDYLTRLRSWMS